MDLQEILVYILFAVAIGYFAYRFYIKNFRKTAVVKGDKSCGSNDCGCA